MKIASLQDLKMQQRQSEHRIREQETELRKRLNQVPGELFYSGVDSMIPSFLTGKVSSFALNAGKGLINNFFVRKAVTTGGLKFLKLTKPSFLLKKLGSGVRGIIRRK